MEIIITTIYKLNDDEINTIYKTWKEDIKNNLYWKNHNTIKDFSEWFKDELTGYYNYYKIEIKGDLNKIITNL